jgi:uncharacterized protein (TIGR03437 family)
MASPFDALGFAGAQFLPIRAATVLLLACACTFAQNTVTTVSAADYAADPLAPGSIVSMFAPNIAQGVFVATNPPPAPLPYSLGGVSATLTEQISGITLPISLIAVTPNQVNAVLPGWLFNYEEMIVNLTTSSGAQISGRLSMAWTAPSIFTADESGGGVPAAQVVIGHADGSQTFIGSIANCTSTGCTPIPINLGSSTDEVVLELFGTGIRGLVQICGLQSSCQTSPAYPPAPPVTVMAFMSTPPYSTLYPALPILYYGPQGAGAPGSFYGLDQINVLLPHTMVGLGKVNLTLLVAADPTWQEYNGYVVGQPIQSNIVTVDIQ